MEKKILKTSQVCQLVSNYLTWFSFSCRFLLPLPLLSLIHMTLWISPVQFWHKLHLWLMCCWCVCFAHSAVVERWFCVHSFPGTAATDWGVWSERGASMLPNLPARWDRDVQHHAASHRLQPHLWQQWVGTNKNHTALNVKCVIFAWQQTWKLFVWQHNFDSASDVNLGRGNLFLFSGRPGLCLMPFPLNA